MTQPEHSHASDPPIKSGGILPDSKGMGPSAGAAAAKISPETAHPDVLLTRLQRLESRLAKMEELMKTPSRSSGGGTFFMAMLAAGLAALAVPWEEMPGRFSRFKEQLHRVITAAAPPGNERTGNALPSPKPVFFLAPEPVLPEKPSEALTDALLLLPDLSAKPAHLQAL